MSTKQEYIDSVLKSRQTIKNASSNQNQGGSALDSYVNSVRDSRARIDRQTNRNAAVDADYVNQYLSDYSDFYGGYMGNTDGYSGRYDNAMDNFAWRGQKIRDWLDFNQGSLDPEYYAWATGMMNNIDIYTGQMGVEKGFRDYTDWYNSSLKGLEGMDWATGVNAGGMLTDDIQGYNDRAAASRQWLDANREFLGEDYYQYAVGNLDSMAGYNEDLAGYYTGQQDFFRQWDNAEDYERWVYLKDLDTDAMAQDIADMEKRITDLQNSTGGGVLRRMALHGAGLYSAEDVLTANREIEDAEAQLLQMRSDLKEATLLQQGIQEDEWAQEYAGMSYDQIMPILYGMEDGAEKEWLSQYAPSTMTTQDMTEKKAENNTRLYHLNGLVESYDQLMASVTYDVWGRVTADSISQAEALLKENGFSNIQDVKAEIEALTAENWELDNRAQYEGLPGQSDFAAMSTVPQGYTISGGAVSKFDFINNINNARERETVGMAMNGGESPYAAYAYMDDSEIAIYNYLYNTEGSEAADEYLEYIQYDLNARKMADVKGAAKWIGQEGGIAGSLLSVPANLMGIAGIADVGVQHLARGLSGEYKPIDYNRTAMTGHAVGQGIRQAKAEKYNAMGTIQLDPEKNPVLARILNGKGWGDVYQLGMSMLDSWATAGLNRIGLGSAATLLLSGSAATQGVLDAVERGASDQQALTMGILNGMAEWFFEKYELDQLLGRDTTYVKAMLNQGATEAFGEGATSIANTLTDAIVMAGNSEFADKVEEYMLMGYSREEATMEAFTDTLIEIGWDAAGGFLMGGIMGGGQQAITNMTMAPEVRANSRRLQELGASRYEADQAAMELSERGSKYGAQGKYFAENYLPEQNVEEYDLEFQTAYELGKAGGSREALGKVTTFRVMSASQQDIAYSAGVEARKKAADIKTEKPEATFRASESGNTLRNDTGAEIEIKGFAKVGDQPQLDIGGGKTIEAENVSYGSAEEAVLYETIGKVAGSANTANGMLKAFREAEGISAADFADGLWEAYEAGRTQSATKPELKDGEFAKVLPVGVRSVAYDRGAAKGRGIAAAQEAVTKAKGYQRKGQRKEGQLHFDRKGRTFDEAKERALGAVEAVAKALGLQIYVYESFVSDGKRVYVDANGKTVKAPNGFYDPADGSIHIDLNAGNLGQGTMLFTLSHELTHYIREWSPVRFRILADTLLAAYEKDGLSVSALVERQMLKAKENGRELTREQALEEVVADSMESMLADGSFGEVLARIQSRDKTLWQKIRDWFRDVAEKLKAAADDYRGAAPDSTEGKLVRQMDEMYAELQKLFAEGLVEASGNYAAAEGQKNTTREGGVKYSFGGAGSRTADKSAYLTAVDMEAQGVDNERIRQETGWYRGKDGKWRYEIDDSKMELSRDISNYMLLGDLIKHDALFSAYPDLAGISVVFHSLDSGISGAYNPQFDSIDLSYSLKNDPIGLKDSLIHEIQHAIQHREGFTKGATVSSWERKIKAGFDSRKAADIRKAQETERELNRIQKEEPEFYRDMVELDAMTPDVPRGEIDWDTLEKIQEDPIEWQEYDARREELEAKYGDTKVWDMNDLLYQREQAAKNVGRSGLELYYDTAGEIEARDAANRRALSSEQRKTSPPRLGNEDTVFFEEVETTHSKEDKKSRASNSSPLSRRSVMQRSAGSTHPIMSSTAAAEILGVSNIASASDDVKQTISILGIIYESIGKPKPVLGLGRVIRGSNLESSLIQTGILTAKGTGGSAYRKYGDHELRMSNHSAHADNFVGVGEHLSIALYKTSKANNFLPGNQNVIEAVFKKDFLDKNPKALKSLIKDIAHFIADGEYHDTAGAMKYNYSGSEEFIKTAQKRMEEDKKKRDMILFSDRDPTAAATMAELEKQNAALRGDVEELKKLLALQGQVTGGRILKKSSVDAAGRWLKKYAGATMESEDMKTLSGMLMEFYTFLSNDDEYSWEDVMERAAPIADYLQARVNVKPQISEYARDVLRELKGRKIKLSESQKAEVIKAYGSYNDYRKAAFGSVTISNDGMSLDSVWNEMAKLFPGTFDEEVTAGDQPMALLDVIQGLRSTDQSAMEYAYNREFIRADLIRAVYDSFWRVKNIETVADRNAKEVNAIKAKHRQQMETLRQEKNEAIQRVKKQRADDIEKVRQEMRQEIRDRVTATEKRYQESRTKATEKRRQTAAKGRLKKLVQEISNLYENGTKERNVKKGMRGFVEQALAAATVLWTDNYTDEDIVLAGVGMKMERWEQQLLEKTQELIRQREDVFKGGRAEMEAEAIESGETDGLDALTEQYEKLNEQIRKNMRRLQRVLRGERQRLNETTITAVLEGLAEAYKQLGSSDDNFIRAGVYENVYQGLKDLIDDVRGTTVQDMTSDQLEAVERAYRMVLHTIRDANKSFTNEKAGTIAEQGQAAAEEIKAVGGFHEDRVGAADPIRKFWWNNLKPVYAFERIGSKTLKDAFNAIRKGEDVWAVDVNEARDFFRKAAERYGYDSWDTETAYTFKTPAGKEFKLTLGQMMSIYAYSKRQNAKDHLRIGGVVFDPNQEVYREGGKKGKLKWIINDATAYQIGEETVAQILGQMTEEQIGFVDQMQEYLSETMGAKGNEVSTKLYGIDLFGEKNYFPMKSARQFLFEQNQPAGEVSLKNSGFTKAIQPGANNPLILGSFMDVWSQHVNQMSTYHGFALPIEDFNRIFNYQTPRNLEMTSRSVKAALQGAYTPAAVEYISQMLRDVNGGARMDPAAGIMNKMMSLFKKGAVFASLSVVIQQPSAIGRAAALIDPKYFSGKKVSKQNIEESWEEAKKYAPVALIKEMGFFDTGVGRSTQEYIMAKEYKGLKEQAKALATDSDFRDEMLGMAPALADNITWAGIWNAVKREQKDLHKDMDVESEEFLKICGDRFTEVITKTQVYDSVLSRSANMRSKDTGMKMATAFMAEPTTSINMITDAIIQARRGVKGYPARAIGAVVAAQILNSILVSFVYAARDDDKEKTYWEKYLKSLADNIWNDVFLMVPNSIPFIADVMSMLQGYDVERADMSVISDFIAAIRKLEDKKRSPWEKIEAFSGAMAQIFGFPLKNIIRDLKGLNNVLNHVQSNVTRELYGLEWNPVLGRIEKTYHERPVGTAAGAGYAILEGLTGEKTSKAQQLYEATVKGDRWHIARMEGMYSGKESTDAAIRSVIKELYMSGEIDREEAEKQLFNYAGMEIYEAWWTVDAWVYEKDKGYSDGYSKYDDIYEAMLEGGDITELMAEFTDHGYKEEDVLSSLKTQIGRWYYDDESETRITREQAEDMLVQYMGMKGDDLEDQMRKWDMKLETGFSYTELKGEFLERNVTKEDAIIMLKKYGGLTNAEAEEKVGDWVFERQYGFAYSDMRELYLDDELSEYDARIHLRHEGGKDDEDIEYTIRLWNFEKEHGWAYEDRVSLYKSGELSNADLKKALVEFGGYSSRDATTQIEVYNWELDGLKNVTISRVEKWHEFCEPIGIGREVFLDVQRFSYNTKNDVDPDTGKTINYSAMKKVMAYIDSLKLTDEQKDALAYSLGWSKKNIEKYKPW